MPMFSNMVYFPSLYELLVVLQIVLVLLVDKPVDQVAGLKLVLC